MKHETPLRLPRHAPTPAVFPDPNPASADPSVDENAGVARDHAGYRFAKRCFDLAVGSAILALLAPVVPVVALMIRLDSPGPVFYRQKRIGRGGRPFDFLKFRSMYVDADRRQGELETLNEQDG